MKNMHFKTKTVIQGLGQFIGLTSNMSMDFLFRFLNPITVTDKKTDTKKTKKQIKTRHDPVNCNTRSGYRRLFKETDKFTVEILFLFSFLKQKGKIKRT